VFKKHLATKKYLAQVIRVQSVLTSALDDMNGQCGTLVIPLQGDMPVPAQGMGGPQSRSGHFGERNIHHQVSIAKTIVTELKFIIYRIFVANK
jgi:hypothetical protein